MNKSDDSKITFTFSDENDLELFKWVESKVKEGSSDEEILEELEEFELTEHCQRFVEWALYFFRFNGVRNDETSPSIQDKKTNNEKDCSEEKNYEDLLDEFIKDSFDEEDDSSDDESEIGDNSDLDDDGSGLDDNNSDDCKIANVEMAINENPTPKPKDFVARYIPYPLFMNDRFIHLRIFYWESVYYKHDIEVVVQNYRCHTILRKEVTKEQLDSNEGDVEVTFDAEDLIPTRHSLEDEIQISILNSDTKKVLYNTSKKLLCANSVFDLLSINRMVFFPAFRDSSPLSSDTVTGYVEFKEDAFLQINAHCYFNSRVKLSHIINELCFCLYDQNGKLIIRNNASTYEIESEKVQIAFYSFNPVKGVRWDVGRYKVEFRVFDRPVMIASFNVGTHNLEGEADVAQIVSMLKDNALRDNTSEKAMDRLDQLIGLKTVKEKIHSISRLSMLSQLRKDMGLPTTNAPLHACFIGSPGTGKTTVAKIIGEIYKDLGLLSQGHVVKLERRNLVGRYYDSELRATEQAIQSAQGGVLFIDEAYNLYVPDDPRDPGKRVLESLLTALSDEKRRDWMLVLAGYPDEIGVMMKANPGLESRINERFFFDDYNLDELMQIADLYCKRNKYKMSAEVRKHLYSIVARDYGSRDKDFGNARYINNLMEKTIIPKMAHRISYINNPTKVQLQTIEIEDVPSLRKEGTESRGMVGLNQMVGLSNLKHNLYQHLNVVRLANMRMKQGLHTQMPPLHMIFTGNPGTGKTTVADFLGEIFASMGLLSRGDVVRVEKKDLVGSHIGETEQKMKSILNRAKGNILFIDEAYQLYSKEGENDYGKIVIESLLTTLSNDKIDMIVILAGYPKEMELLLKMNDGLPSRFPYKFHFEDYSVEELHKIVLRYAADNNYSFTKKAEVLMKAIIKREVLRKRSSFGNARFVIRLFSTEVLSRMATRLSTIENVPTKRQLKTIIAEDIPITKEEVSRIERGCFDEKAIDEALKKLDNLVGQVSVKRAIHNFVDIARYLNSKEETFVGKGLLKWNFVGNTGTGKSVVAKILAEILKAMNLLDKGNIVEVRGEQIFNVSEYQCDQVLSQAMKLSQHGLLFIDGDAPEFRNMHEYRLTSEQLRIKLTSLVAEIGGQGALVIAECNSPRQTIANSLAINGIYDFDHTFFFDDYTSDELYQILCQLLNKRKIKFTREAEFKIREYIDLLCSNRSLSFANARTMKHLARTIYEQVILRASRDKSSPHNRVLLEDVAGYNWQQPRKIGFNS